MSVHDINSNIMIEKKQFAGVVLDATNNTNRFLAMKQLFDIAKRRCEIFSVNSDLL